MPATDDADKLELLLEAFKRADGKRWALREIQAATGEQASASYLSSIRAGRIKRVGARQKQATARVMGFPIELWDAEPEHWPYILEEKRRAAASGAAPPAPLCELLEDLFRYARHPLTRAPFTERSVAELSGGELTEEEVRDMRQGRVEDPPEEKLLTLSDVFRVPPSYWDRPRTVPALDEDTARFLAGPNRLRSLHMRLLDLPETQRDEIGDKVEELVDRARRRAAADEEGRQRPESPPSTARNRRTERRASSASVLGSGAWRSLAKYTRRLRRRIEKTASAVVVSGADHPLRFSEYLKELRVLGLEGRYFSWEVYRNRLEAHLGIEVLVRFLDDPLARMALLGDDLGRVYRDEETGDALVLVSGQLDEFEVLEVIYHELGHVAGGHPLPRGEVVQGLSMGSFDARSLDAESEGAPRDRGWWDPPRSVLGPTAPRDEGYCEREATLRAEYSILAGHYGYDHGRGDESFFRLDPLPRPCGPTPQEGER